MLDACVSTAKTPPNGIRVICIGIPNQPHGRLPSTRGACFRWMVSVLLEELVVAAVMVVRQSDEGHCPDR